MQTLKISNVNLTYPGIGSHPAVVALKGVNLTIEKGDFVVALGASGCGKTTLLSLMSGFMAPSEGELTLGGRPHRRPGRRPRRRVPEARAAALAQRHARTPSSA